MRFKSLDDWLAWQESLNPKEIDLGLERVSQVLQQAGLEKTFDCPLITVAGTNGKGSVVAMLEAIAMSAGLKVCSYTSPHIFNYNERIKINTQPVDEVLLCEAFQRIDQARISLSDPDQQQSEVALTYFEFGTLAAINIFHQQQPDLVILEVGLGGRLDAVNIMDADVSVITSIDIDHVDWLGDNRELIGYEKAGIFREFKAVVCGELEPPVSLLKAAESKHCPLLLLGRDYKVIDTSDTSWRLQNSYAELSGLPTPNLTGEFQKNNAATAIMAFQLLLNEKKLLIKNTDSNYSGSDSPGADSLGSDLLGHDLLVKALSHIKLYGRFQCDNSRPSIYVDVAHNPQAAQALSSQLKITQTAGKTWAIIAMLVDKDAAAVVNKLADDVDIWCFTGLDGGGRGQSAHALFEVVKNTISRDEKPVIPQQNQCTMLSETLFLAEDVVAACDMVLAKAASDDRIIIFGSFFTVAEAMNFFSDDNLYV
jgi:dihydrofolate synthase/folylpolyglutamate synthase